MDHKKIGDLLLNLRKEKHMTQKQVADQMNISDKTISKWERGLGCPDVSLLQELSTIFGVKIEAILSGDMNNQYTGGNMKKIKFYVCPTCGNILTSVARADISCCGRTLTPLKSKVGEHEHRIEVDMLDGQYYVHLDHEMTKEHYISFIAYVSYDSVHIVRLYPQQEAYTWLPYMKKGDIYAYCVKDGLWKK